MKNLKIGLKLAIGFGSLLTLILVAGLVGFSGIKTVDHSMTIIADEEAPIVDTAMEMKISLQDAMIALDEYLSATSVISRTKADNLPKIEEAYQQALKAFDQGAEAILNGGKVGDVEVIQTDNEEIASIVRQADDIHNGVYQTTASELMADGKALLLRKSEENAAMEDMEKSFKEISQDAAHVEEIVSGEINSRIKAANIGGEALSIIQEEVPLADMSMEMKFVIAQTRIALEEYVQSHDENELDLIETKYRQLLSDFDEKVAAVLHGAVIDGSKVIATDNSKIKAAVRELDQNHEVFQAKAQTIMSAHRALLTQTSEIEGTMERLDAAGAKAANIIDQIELLAGKEMGAAKIAGRVSSKNASNYLLAVVVASVFVGVLLGVVITKSITKPVAKTVHMIQELEHGNLDLRLNMDRNDEIGNMAKALDGFADNMKEEVIAAFNKLAEGDLTFEAQGVIREPLAKANAALNDVMSQIQVAGEQIASGSEQVSDTAQSLSQGATESAASLEEISASLNELSSQTSTNAENASQANNLAIHARDAAQEGSAKMEAMVSAMAEINDSGQNISKIIKTIDEIAFQTNLLALNAAVEAARAGQHGKGFAVVAEEVRNLAARSAKAAKETSELIQGSVEKTENGSAIAIQTAEALQKIVGGIGSVSDLVAEIAAASSEQAQGVNQINQGITQIDQVTQQNTANAEESAAAAEELSGQSSQLHQMLQRFTLATNLAQRTFVPPVKTDDISWNHIDSADRSPALSFNEGIDSKEFGKY